MRFAYAVFALALWPLGVAASPATATPTPKAAPAAAAAKPPPTAAADCSPGQWQIAVLGRTVGKKFVAAPPSALALGRDVVVFGGHTIGWMPKTGGEAVDAAEAQPDHHVSRIVVHRQDLFWIESSISPQTPSFVMTMPIGGSAPRVLYRGTVPDDTLAVDDKDVWFVISSAKKSADIVRLARAGGKPVTVKRIPSQVCSIALDGPDLYAANCEASQILRMPKTGGAAVVLTRTAEEPYRIEIHDDQLVFDVRDNGLVYTMHKTRGDPHPVSAAHALTGSFVADGSDVYFCSQPYPGSNRDDGSMVVWAAPGTGIPRFLDVDANQQVPIAAGDGAAYWAHGSEIWRMTRCH